MRTLIYTFLALFIWAAIPVDAIASRSDRNDRRSTTYSEHDSYDRHGKRAHHKKHYRKHHRKVKHTRPQHWRPTQRVKYVPVPEYRNYSIPSWYVYSSTPGITLYFSW